MSTQKNVLDKRLEMCSTMPMTGFNRDGMCTYREGDGGKHLVCAHMTKEFLEFTKEKGNDLTTPLQPHFPGLKPGDKWCICAARYSEAANAGKAPPIALDSTHIYARRWKAVDEAVKAKWPADAKIDAIHRLPS